MSSAVAEINCLRVKMGVLLHLHIYPICISILTSHNFVVKNCLTRKLMVSTALPSIALEKAFYPNKNYLYFLFLHKNVYCGYSL